MRQIGRVDLHDRPNHHDRPFGMGIGNRRDHLQVHALVDHAVEAEARPRQRALIVRSCVHGTSPREMRTVDARRERVDVRMAVLLRLVEAVAAGEDHVGAVDQLLLERQQLGRREAEVGELVHAIIDGADGIDVPGEWQHHRGVVPTDERLVLTGEKSSSSDLSALSVSASLRPSGSDGVTTITPVSAHSRTPSAGSQSGSAASGSSQ
jgi:hypothetical protein